MAVTREYADSTVLVVDADPSRLERTVTVLGQAGYACTRATSVADARAMLAEQPPDLLITGVRVRSVSGFDLVLQRYLTDRQSIVIDTEVRPGLAAEAGRLDAHYLVHPVGSQRLLRTVAEQLRRQRGDERRRWPRAALRAGIPIALQEGHETLMDVSYGGFQIAVTGGVRRPPTRVALQLVPLTRTVQGRLAWQTAVEDGLACGLTLVNPDHATDTAWRQWVDQVAV